jgi:uncharacterized protein DUF1259
MSIVQAASPFSRRRALKLGAGFSGALVAAASFGSQLAFADDRGNDDFCTTPSEQQEKTIQDILEAEGMAINGVFQVEIDRNDIMNVMLHSVPILPSFQINGTSCFQVVKGGQLTLNGDMALKPNELDPFISALITHGLVFEAEHQHMYDFEPDVWFVHYRGVGSAEFLARALKAALNETSTPFPQTNPSNPTTPLPAQEIGEILGADPQIGADGVVTYYIPRKNEIVLGGCEINPYLNVATNVAFQPYGGGQNAAVIPDYSLVASEINKVVGYTLSKDWDIGCLYNQETDEHPQLYFSHQFKVGNSVALAREIRTALDMTNSKFK